MVASAAVVLLAIALLAVWQKPWARDIHGQHAVGSVAVLPFSGDTGTEYLSDGIAGGVRYTLSEIPDLKVISSSSVLQYRGKSVAPLQVGQDLNVAAVVTGSFRKHGDDILVQVELADTRDNALLWGQQFAGKTADLQRMEEEIATAIGHRLKLSPSNATGVASVSGNREHAAAYDAYLRGQFERSQFTPESVTKALSEFKNAVALDPHFAEAYAEEAFAYFLLTQPLGVLPDKNEGFRNAKQAALKALELDDKQALAHSVLGWVSCFYDWNWKASETEFQRALELNPNLAEAYVGRAFLLSVTGRHDQAIAAGRRAIELAPLDLSYRTALAEQLQAAGRSAEAEKECKEVLKIDPNFVRAQQVLAWVYEYSGQPDRAIFMQKQFLSLAGATPNEINEMAQAYQAGGMAAVHRADIASALKVQPPRYYELATLYATIGDRDHAIEYLRKALEAHEPSLIFLAEAKEFDPIRTDPRFREILQKMKFPQVTG
jgi:TolB-like protein